MRTMTAARRFILCIGLLANGCAPPPAAPPPAQPAPQPFTSGTPAERWFPLVQGHIYQYATRQGDDPNEGLLVVTARRGAATSGALQLPNKTRSFQYGADGVRLLGAGSQPYVLKMPLAVGTRWRGEHGGEVSITAVGASVQVPAGPFQDCITTREARGGDVPLTVTTTFCPEVGIVLLDAASGGQSERAALRSYGPPVNLGPDGVRRIP